MTAFFDAFAKVQGFKKASIVGFELDAEEAAKAHARARDVGLAAAKIRLKIFSSGLSTTSTMLRRGLSCGRKSAVCALSVPPRAIPASRRTEISELKLPFTKHTNAWVPFLLASMALLRPGGRLAMVVPAEIIHVTHAQSLRSYLGLECRRLVIVDPEELWFDGTLQGAVILFAEKKQSQTDTAKALVCIR